MFTTPPTLGVKYSYLFYVTFHSIRGHRFVRISEREGTVRVGPGGRHGQHVSVEDVHFHPQHYNGDILWGKFLLSDVILLIGWGSQEDMMNIYKESKCLTFC